MDRKHTLILDLFDQGKLDVDCSSGKVFNLVTQRELGYQQNEGYKAFAWKVNGVPVHFLCHRVIWWLCRGTIPDGLIINHINGIKCDNRLLNLELVTYQENTQHAFAMGLADNHATGRVLHERSFVERSPTAKLTDLEVMAIPDLILINPKRNTLRTIARRFNVHHSIIQDALKRKTYKHINWDELF